jgi:primosomal protein N' (replication factor Y)
MISKQLAQAISTNLKSGLQTLLFLNRRGSARALICNNCGQTTNCPNCNICLNYHADLGKLICHYCNYRTSPIAVCGYCGNTDLRFFGDGTKKLEAEIKNLWPKARVSRVDRDQSEFDFLQATYNLLKAGEIDIILGTQMISRGLDIDKLSLVGIIDADVSLNIPDFTAGERTFQLLSQTAGRAGRRRDLGQVIIQTRNPNNPIIESATHHDYYKFYQLEAANRNKYAYPPYCYLVKLQYVHKNPQTAIGSGNELKLQLAKTKGITLLGPTLHHKRTALRQSIAQIVVKSRSRAVLVKLVENLPPNWIADLDPISLI